MLKLITVSGPRGAGKEETVKRLQREFPDLRRVVPHTTRSPRNGEVNGREYHFVSESEFDALIQCGELVFSMEMRSQRSGTTRAELAKSPFAVVDITPGGARELRELLTEEGGSVFTVFIHASRAEREGRIRLRQPHLTEAEIQAILEDDPAEGFLWLYADSNLIVGNPDGEFESAASRVVAAARRFLGVGVLA